MRSTNLLIYLLNLGEGAKYNCEALGEGLCEAAGGGASLRLSEAPGAALDV